MSSWGWKAVLVIVIAKTILVCYLRADDTVQKLPFCNPGNLEEGPVHNDVMIVSTLDGKLTAFSTQNGIKLWVMETQPLLSSNLHQVELTSGGKWVRLVPSLRGTLYSVSGETIEPLPFDAEQLLSASYKYNDDLVIAGAKETVWYGLDANTGSVLYECGYSGCNNEQAATSAKDVLVLRRHSNTVRALDPRLGNEKWNFSVAEHKLALSRGECAGGAAPGEPTPYQVAVALHDGRLALKVPGGSQPIWQQQLEAPLAGMWRLSSGALNSIDVLWEATQTIAPSGVTHQPSLYIGVHERQLYVHESPRYTPKLETAVGAPAHLWKLVSARPQGADTALQVTDNALTQVMVHGASGMAGDYGFFLYLQETCDQSVQVSSDAIDAESEADNSSNDEEHHHIHVHVYSLWFWWKEVLLIAISSALLLNLMIRPRYFSSKLSLPTPVPTNQQYIVVEHRYPAPLPPVAPPTPEYSSRYETDFSPLQCLGRGGFGVVFEARNNIDHASYAVKRITLPKKEEKRERVLREVRALAKLEHEHIVRYFNAWVEQPPPLWQLQRDALLMREMNDVSLAMSDESVSSPPEVKASKGKGSVMLDLQLPMDHCVDALDFEKRLQDPSKRLRSLSCSDSFIVFDETKDASEAVTRSVHSSDVTIPNTLSKRMPSDDDSYVVFEHSHGHVPSAHHNISGHSPVHNSHSPRQSSHSPGQSGHVSSGYSEARQNSTDKRLERVKECEYQTGSTSKNKKKGHTRHWSLDMVVKSSSTQADKASMQMYLYIQMQLCRRDSLHDWLRNNRTLEARGATAKTLFSQIVSAVDYVHLAGLIHRDLKPSNILFALDGRVKVGDFGLVTAMGDTSSDGERPEEGDAHHRHTYRVGTHLYMSPEQLKGLPYSYKVDIYSLGLILLELLQPFDTESERISCLMRVRNHLYPKDFHDKYPSEMKVLKLMLSEDPSHRPTASGVKARAPLHEPTDARTSKLKEIIDFDKHVKQLTINLIEYFPQIYNQINEIKLVGPDGANEYRLLKNQFESIASDALGETIACENISVDLIDIKNVFKILTDDQRNIVMHIYYMYKNKNKVGEDNPKIILQGPAGTGKSTIINLIEKLITWDENRKSDSQEIKVMKCAFTAKAASNIYGLTLHSMFSIPIYNTRSLTKKLLDDSKKELLKNCIFFICDEVSMVGEKLMSSVNMRLQEIFGNTKLYGDRFVLLVGDLYQIDPVLQTPVYPKSELWTCCEFYELTKIIRQHDEKFINALNNFRDSKMSNDDIDLLRSREIQNVDQVPDSVIHLFGRYQLVDEFNTMKIDKSNEKEEIVNALEESQYGHPSNLRVKRGIRYMIIHNLDVSDGLANGTTGVVKHFDYDENGCVVVIWMEFHSNKIGENARSNYFKEKSRPGFESWVPIHRSKMIVRLKPDPKVSRIIGNVFPLKAAEAITVHNSQGQTYHEGVCIHLTTDKYDILRTDKSLQYVALTRVKRLEDLYICGTFNISVTNSNKFIRKTNELNRLRTERPLKLAYETFDNKTGDVVVHLNTGLTFKEHYQFITTDKWYHNASLLIFTETNTVGSDIIEISNFEIAYRSDEEVAMRSAGGIICYKKPNVSVEVVCSISDVKNKFYLTLLLYENYLYIITGVKGGLYDDKFQLAIQTFMSYIRDKQCICFVGNLSMNINKTQSLTDVLSNRNFKEQLSIEILSTDAESRRDQVFTRNIDITPDSIGFYEYIPSSHKPMFVMLPSKSELM